jgi:hypothetical protein
MTPPAGRCEADALTHPVTASPFSVRECRKTQHAGRILVAALHTRMARLGTRLADPASMMHTQFATKSVPDTAPSAALTRGLLLVALGSSVACARTPTASKEDPAALSTTRQAAAEATPEETRLDASTPALLPPSTSAGPDNLQAFNARVPAPGAPGERPSVSQNMGRGFQGTLLLRVHEGAQTHELRYLSLGDRARIQIDARTASSGHPPLHFDALIEGDDISVFDHSKRTLHSVPLAQIQPKDTSDAASVHVEKTGESVTLSGVPCEPYQIQDAKLRVTACVSALPGTFDIGKFESVSGIRAPAWVEALLKQQRFPLRASATDSTGHERYSLELVEYTPGPVNAALLTVPSAYRRL